MLKFRFLNRPHTGARISEVLAIDDQQDVDFRSGDVRLITLKRHNEKKKGARRIVPVPLQVVNEIARYLAMFPEQKGKVFESSGDGVLNYQVLKYQFRCKCIYARDKIGGSMPFRFFWYGTVFVVHNSSSNFAIMMHEKRARKTL